MFDFVGQNTKLCDTCVKLVPPKQDIGDMLWKSLQFLSWKHIGMFGGYSGACSWDGVDELWRVVENELESHFNIMASMTYTNSHLALLQEHLWGISSIARDEERRGWTTFSIGRETFELPVASSPHLDDPDSFWKEVLTNQKMTHFPKVYGSVLLIALSSYRKGHRDEGFWKQVYRTLRRPPFHSTITLEEQEDGRTLTQDGVVRDVELGQVRASRRAGTGRWSGERICLCSSQYVCDEEAECLALTENFLKGDFCPELELLPVSPYSAYLYDAILLYAETVKQMIKAGGDFQDGQQLVNALEGSVRPWYRSLPRPGEEAAGHLIPFPPGKSPLQCHSLSPLRIKLRNVRRISWGHFPSAASVMGALAPQTSKDGYQKVITYWQDISASVDCATERDVGRGGPWEGQFEIQSLEPLK
ncbi:hypothetical protein P7K49_024455 [Saguinus oedipus]|uniref:Receptor ligand binding region domain-containing protein n=1 Tax=Saguinus oedipus TaxID=9490 RepID=A0ABQ9UPK4_SAGOE|nr:hypothetical protein P7K49_024455 [Saguinus oedipus]